MKRKLLIFFFAAIITCLFISPLTYAASIPAAATIDTTEDVPEPMDDPLGNTVPSYVTDKHSIFNYSWDPNGFWGRFDPLHILGYIFFTFAVFITRLGIWILSLGFSPSSWLSPTASIAQFIQDSRFIDKVWPIFALVAAGVLTYDFIRNNYTRMLSRGVFFGVVILYLIVFNQWGSKYLGYTVDVVSEATEALAGVVITANEPADQKQNFGDVTQKIYEYIWVSSIRNPWEAAEFGTIGKKVKDHDIQNYFDKVIDKLSDSKLASALAPVSAQAAEEMYYEGIKNAMRAKPGFLGFFGAKTDLDVDWVTPDTYWRDIILMFPPGSEPREQLANILMEEDINPDSGGVFNGAARFLMGLMTFLISLAIFCFCGVMGGYLLIVHFLFLLSVAIGPIILAILILPVDFSNRAFMWFNQMLLGSLIIKVALGLYVGLTFLAINIMTDINNPVNYGGTLLAMLPVPVILVLSLYLLSRIQKRFRPVERATGAVGQMLSPNVDAYGNADSYARTNGKSTGVATTYPSSDSVEPSSRRVDVDMAGDRTAYTSNSRSINNRGEENSNRPGILKRAIEQTKRRTSKGDNFAGTTATFMTNVGIETARSVGGSAIQLSRSAIQKTNQWLTKDAERNPRDNGDQPGVRRQTIERSVTLQNGKTIRATIPADRSTGQLSLANNRKENSSRIQHQFQPHLQWKRQHPNPSADTSAASNRGPQRQKPSVPVSNSNRGHQTPTSTAPTLRRSSEKTSVSPTLRPHNRDATTTTVSQKSIKSSPTPLLIAKRRPIH